MFCGIGRVRPKAAFAEATASAKALAVKTAAEGIRG